MYTHAGIYISYETPDWPLLHRAMASMLRGAQLDVVIAPIPPTIPELEVLVARIYGSAPPRPSDLDLVVYNQARTDKWEHTFNQAPSFSQICLNSTQKYDCVAVGGTWDHMHWGHRLMLSMAAFTAQTKVIIGVTGSELLQNKQYAEALETYDQRANAATAFVRLLRPDLEVDPQAMHDMYGPTTKEANIQALVVSKETSNGGNLVNLKRQELHLSLLDIIEVKLIEENGNKLSSTDLRREELDRLAASN